MILQALVQHYEDLAAKGAIAPPGWGPAKVSFALYLDGNGELTRVVSVKTEQTRGKKTALQPQIMRVPEPVKRSSGIAANFLCDNAGYMLGADNKGNPQRTRDCFAACKALHEALLTGVDSPAAAAVLAFFRNWNPDTALEHPALQEARDDILGGANLVFRHVGQYVHEDAAVRTAWQAHYDTSGDGPCMTCLVTGKQAPIAQLHPSIKGVRGAQSSGASLVSFNADSFCSYNRKQGLNAPTSKYAAFAYGTALNHLIADWEHTGYMGNTLVLFWASGGETAYQDVFSGFAFDTDTPYSPDDLRKMVLSLVSGNPVVYDETRLNPAQDFYILGLAPNAARLSVRFFLHNSFGQFLEHLLAHQQRLEIIHSADSKFTTLPLWRLLYETVNQNTKDKSPSPVLEGELLRAILTNTHYPATLLNGVTLRIRAERDITWGRAAILKAYYLQHPHSDIPKEVLTVSLNPDSTNIPYTLGRLFSVLEAIQFKANPGINATIKDKYFNAAAATPAHIFPTLVNLAQKHLRKLKEGQKIYYSNQLQTLFSILGETFPTRLNLPQQGAFQLGYYHQTQERYQSKNKEENKS